jgi:hypothetical protein
MALRCAECGAPSMPATLVCGQCGSSLPAPGSDRVKVHAAPAATRSARASVAGATGSSVLSTVAVADAADNRFVSDAGETRYRIILGDTCPVCRAASRISFTPERPPKIPLAGCQDAEGCRCELPIFASDLDAALSAPHASLEVLAPSRGRIADLAPLDEPKAVAPVEHPKDLEPAPSPWLAPARPPDWTLPAPITQRRAQDLKHLTGLYYQRRIQGIRLQTAAGCCRTCADVAASIYEPSVAPPLPIVGCDAGWQCRCQYAQEPLPLDAQGLEALRRLALQEHERELRRHHVARSAPRRFHQLVVALAALIALGALGQRFDRARTAPWQILLPLALAGACAAVAAGAMVRRRLLPPPQWIDVVCGAVVAVTGLRSTMQVRLPGGLRLGDLGQVTAARFSLELSPKLLLSLPHGQQALALTGFALLLLGLVGVITGPSYRRTARTQ